MTGPWTTAWRASLTRRAVAKQLGGAMFAAAFVRVTAPRGPGSAAAVTAKSPTESTNTGSPQPIPVVSFFLDQPYLDTSGSGMPYQPPQGMLAGQPLAALSEFEFRNINPHA